MGFLHNGVCWSTYDEAMSVKFGADPVLETSATNGVDKIHFYDWVNGAWYWSEWSTTGGAWTFQYHSPMPVITFPDCVVDPAAAAAAQLLNSTPTQILNVFGFGFGAVMLFWFLGFVIAVAMRAIEKT